MKKLGRRGFTLAEVIVSILILGFGLSMCAKMVARGCNDRCGVGNHTRDNV